MRKFGITLAGASITLAAIPTVALADEVVILAETDHVTIIQEGDWVRYDYASNLLDSYERTYQGERTDFDSCHFSGKDEWSDLDQDYVVEEREIGNNIAECIMITETGIQPDSSPDSRLADDGEQWDEAVWSDDPDSDPGDPSSLPPGETATTSAWHRTYYEDPPGFDVNWVRTQHYWDYNGACVTDSRDHYAVWDALEQSGWRLEQGSVRAKRVCNYAQTLAKYEFFNGVFCMGHNTWTEYWPNRLRGKPDGGYAMYWDEDKRGGCTFLLSFHREWGRF